MNEHYRDEGHQSSKSEAESVLPLAENENQELSPEQIEARRKALRALLPSVETVKIFGEAFGTDSRVYEDLWDIVDIQGIEAEVELLELLEFIDRHGREIIRSLPPVDHPEGLPFNPNRPPRSDLD